MQYKRLQGYGAIGDENTVALVGRDSSIDWYPFSHVESPSVLAALLDADRGGHVSIRPTRSFEPVQRHRDCTDILETMFRTANRSVPVTDFMPVDGLPEADGPLPAVYRKLDCEDGLLEIDVASEPRFDCARGVPDVEAATDGVGAVSDDERALLSSDLPLEPFDDQARDRSDRLQASIHWRTLTLLAGLVIAIVSAVLDWRAASIDSTALLRFVRTKSWI